MSRSVFLAALEQKTLLSPRTLRGVTGLQELWQRPNLCFLFCRVVFLLFPCLLFVMLVFVNLSRREKETERLRGREEGRKGVLLAERGSEAGPCSMGVTHQGWFP